MKFYIASGFENADTVKRVAAVLKSEGHKHTYDWTVHTNIEESDPQKDDLKLCQIAEEEKKA